MTAVIPEGLAPVGVWDARDPEGWWARSGTAARAALMIQAANWMSTRIRRGTDSYRVEFHRLEIGDRAAHFAVVYRYARNGDGYKHNGPDGEIAVEPPVIVPLTELPPAHLLERRAQ